jgi:GNAT superfamily N-acetyltransferase
MAAQDFAQDRVFYVVDSVGPIAMARTWHRAILVDGREQMILALASVCTAPDRRGEGMGRAVVSRALEQCADDGPTALFQTGVPDFYRGLGSRTVRNPVTSSVRGARLFWEPYVCIHPGTADWSESAELDLLGSGW